MSNLATYLDDNLLYAKAFLENDYSLLNEYIDKIASFTYKKVVDNSIYGYVISVNKPLSDLYEFPFYVIRFIFKNFDLNHSLKQEEIMLELCQNLKKDLDSKRGYYNLRVPSHVVDLIKGINKTLDKCMLCGCTVEETTKRTVEIKDSEDIKVFYANDKYREVNKEKLKNIAHKSFENFIGQYHVSSITNSKAPEIYSNWINTSMLDGDKILVAEVNDEPAGFFSLRDSEHGIEGVLTCVYEKFRGKGVYKKLVSTCINDAVKENKLFVSGTQLENDHVLKAWANLGMAPFYSFYNIHYNNL